MAPQPTDDVYFPDLGGKILELFRAIWIFIRSSCILVSSTVAQVFWDVWTYPPFEAFRNEFVEAFIALENYVVSHPITSMAVIVLLFIVIPAVFDVLRVFLLYLLGYRRRGVLLVSYVTDYQSTHYGGNRFARSQSRRAKGGDRYRTPGGSSWP